jgi:hypothetical protein
MLVKGYKQFLSRKRIMPFIYEYQKNEMKKFKKGKTLGQFERINTWFHFLMQSFSFGSSGIRNLLHASMENGSAQTPPLHFISSLDSSSQGWE